MTKHQEPKEVTSVTGIAWGSPGCPILPRTIRERMAGVEVPPVLSDLFGIRLTFEELNAELLDRCNLSKLPATGRDNVRRLLDEPSILPMDEVVIPPGIPLKHFEHMPLGSRAHHAVETAYRLRDEVSGLSYP